MDKYKVKISKSAIHDLENIAEYLKGFYENTSVKMYDEFVTKISNLKEFPFMYPQAKDKRLAKKGYRILVIEDYLVFYIVNENIVRIKRILHGKQNYLFLLH